MRLLNRYIARGFLLTVTVTLTVVVFVMLLVSMVKVVERFSAALSGPLVVKMIGLVLPGLLMFALPISALTGTLLIFGRLSNDGEITAMRACGLSIWQVVRAPVAIAFVLTLATLYVNGVLGAQSHYEIRKMRADLGALSLQDLLEEGRFSSFGPGLKVYVARKRNDKLEDVIVYRSPETGREMEIRARTGRLAIEDDDIIRIYLNDVQMHPRDMSNMVKTDALTIDAGRLPDRDVPEKRRKDLTLPELVRAIRALDAQEDGARDAEIRRKERTTLVIEGNKRLALAMSCLSFVLLGLPLGIKTHRKESSVGIAISILVIFFYYFFIILAEALRGHPEWRPELIVWFPVVASLAAGLLLLARLNRPS